MWCPTVEPPTLGQEAAGQGPCCRQGRSLPYSLHKSKHLLAFLTDLAACFADETKAEQQFCEVKPWSSVEGKNGTKVSRATRALLCCITFTSSSWRNTFSLSFFSGLKDFSPFFLNAKAQPLMWHNTMHDICPGRELVGASLAVRSQSWCWGWWRCVGSVSQGVSDCQCVGLCVRSMCTWRGYVKEGIVSPACCLPQARETWSHAPCIWGC